MKSGPYRKGLPHDARDYLRATAYAVQGRCAAIAYSSQSLLPLRHAVIICSRDSGATWTPIPLVRSVWSHVRFPGYPVWPPQYVGDVTLEDGVVQIHFRDEWVPFEPGGESQWTAKVAHNGLWRVRRVGAMRYEAPGSAARPAEIAPALPSSFAMPPTELLVRVALQEPPRAAAAVAEWGPWISGVLGGAAAIATGSGWVALGVTLVCAGGVTLLAVMLDRQQRRRACRAPAAKETP